MDIIFACIENYKRKCGESVKNLTFFAVTLPNGPRFSVKFKADFPLGGAKPKIFSTSCNPLATCGVLSVERFRRAVRGRETVANSPRVCYNTREWQAARLRPRRAAHKVPPAGANSQWDALPGTL